MELAMDITANLNSLSAAASRDVRYLPLLAHSLLLRLPPPEAARVPCNITLGPGLLGLVYTLLVVQWLCHSIRPTHNR
jgi:hypothetical protein